MGLTESQMLSYLEDTDLNEDTKRAIVNLIRANNKEIEKSMPQDYVKKYSDFRRDKGMR
ncbi:hypothetical protein BN1080_02064 [Planococcus massiliensis]|uniref:Uncharacterized protein n=1 Tax=Planococcus massiliensis TaxID=1499687 RepID=A0A098EMS4_9BACL|nr:hypothetical protein [Planococcus massiliensis]CEG23120.1 hypothetical protein BN1080_02064 [Planococcus massiliensis]